MDGRAWQAAVHVVAKSRTQLERLHFHFSLSCIGEGNGKPLQCSCLENPRDGGGWWGAVYGVAQSQTRLKQLSSSSSSLIQDCHLHNLQNLPQQFFQGSLGFFLESRMVEVAMHCQLILFGLGFHIRPMPFLSILLQSAYIFFKNLVISLSPWVPAVISKLLTLVLHKLHRNQFFQILSSFSRSNYCNKCLVNFPKKHLCIYQQIHVNILSCFPNKCQHLLTALHTPFSSFIGIYENYSILFHKEFPWS